MDRFSQPLYSLEKEVFTKESAEPATNSNVVLILLSSWGLSDMIRPGFKVHGEYEKGQDTIQFQSIVYDIVEDRLLILRPNVNGLRTGLSIRLRVFPRRGDCYVAEARVVNIRRNTVELLELTMPEKWEKERRRQYFRVPVDLPVQWDDQRGRCLNLSGNGCLFIASTAMEPGQSLALTISLPDRDIPVQARVVRVEPALAGRCRVACTFLEIDERDRDHLLRYLLDRQRELIRQGKMP